MSKKKREVSMGVFDLKQVDRTDGKLNKKLSTVQDTKKIPYSFAYRHNLSYEASGSVYVINKKEHAEFVKAAEENGEVNVISFDDFCKQMDAEGKKSKK